MINMLFSKRFKIIFVFLLFVNFLFVFIAQAGGLVPCGGSGEPECKLCHLWQLFSNIINFVLIKLAVPVAVFMIVIAGFIYITSAGKDKQLQLAKNIIFNVVIGIAIMLSAWLIVDTMIKTIANSSSESGQVIWAWNEFPACSTE